MMALEENAKKNYENLCWVNFRRWLWAKDFVENAFRFWVNVTLSHKINKYQKEE
jgi:hypothetical protein